MYLRVNIPYRYTIVTSPSDSTALDLFPFRVLDESRKSYNLDSQIFVPLNSFQTPWSQFDKKGNIYKCDPQTTLYPAFVKDSKVRPKYLPSTITLMLIKDLGTPLGVSLLPDKKSYTAKSANPSISGNAITNYAELEQEFSARRYKLMKDLAKSYAPFNLAPTQSVFNFTDWVGTQPDLIGVLNSGEVNAATLGKTLKQNYFLNTKDDSGGLTTVNISQDDATRTGITSDSVVVDSPPLSVKYNQQLFSSVDYETHPTFSQGFNPVPFLYSNLSEINTKAESMLHSDTYRGSNKNFTPPLLNWQSIGFPKISQAKNKKLYGRKPVRLSLLSSESGFIEDKDTLIASLQQEGEDINSYYTKIVQPIDYASKRIIMDAALFGDVTRLQDFSKSKKVFTPYSEWSQHSPQAWLKTPENSITNPEDIVYGEQNFICNGETYSYALKMFDRVKEHRHGSNQYTRFKNFPSGETVLQDAAFPIPRSAPTKTITWEDYSIDYETENVNRKWIDTPDGLVQRHPRMEVQTLEPHHSGTKPLQTSDWDLTQKLSDVVIYPLCGFTSRTLSNVPRNLTDEGVYFSPLKEISSLNRASNLLQEHYDGVNLLQSILNDGLLILDTSHMQSTANESEKINLTLLRNFIETICQVPPENFAASGLMKVKLIAPNTVSISQSLELKDEYKGQDLSQYNLTEENRESFDTGYYDIIVNVHADKKGLSVAEILPSQLTITGDSSRWRETRVRSNNFKISNNFEIFKLNPTLICSTQTHTIIHIPKLEKRVQDKGLNKFGHTVNSNKSILSQIQELAFGKFSYNTLHIRDGITLSDPLNKLSLDLKRGNLTARRPVSYTSIFPVLGEKDSVLCPIRRPLYNEQHRKIQDVKAPVVDLWASPLAKYTLESEISDAFKLMATNARMFKPRRTTLNYGRAYAPRDFTVFSEWVFPFENQPSPEDINASWIRSSTSSEKLSYVESRIPQFREQYPLTNSKTQLTWIYPSNVDSRLKERLDNDLASWSLGVPSVFIPETYSLTGTELAILNWQFSL